MDEESSSEKKKRMTHHPRQSTAQYRRLSIGMQPEPLHRKAVTALVTKFDMVGQKTIWKLTFRIKGRSGLDTKVQNQSSKKYFDGPHGVRKLSVVT